MGEEKRWKHLQDQVVLPQTRLPALGSLVTSLGQGCRALLPLARGSCVTLQTLLGTGAVEETGASKEEREAGALASTRQSQQVTRQLAMPHARQPRMPPSSRFLPSLVQVLVRTAANSQKSSVL